MSDTFYNLVWLIGSHIFWVSSRPVVMGREYTRVTGPFIIAANHESNYDSALIIRHSSRSVDPLAAAEVLKKPFPKWFLLSMNSIAVERSRNDAGAVREIMKRLEAGRGVVIFPEGRVQRGEESVIHTRRIRPGVGQLAKMADVPIIPCVTINTSPYEKRSSWLPLKAVRYGIIFGPAIAPAGEAAEIEQRMIEEWVRLHRILRNAMK
jgi:1-acyl-sn-glycerol-3-phosphate acyltransferase